MARPGLPRAACRADAGPPGRCRAGRERPGGPVTGLVIGDDHSVFLDAMSAVLVQRGYEVTVARSVPDTIETVRRMQPDVCLIDRNFAGDDGITAISPMIAASSPTNVFVLS